MMMRKALLKALVSATLLFGVLTNATTQKSEREIAEWVIRQGGRVMLESEREGGKPIGDVVRLPAGEIRIIGVDLDKRVPGLSVTAAAKPQCQAPQQSDLSGGDVSPRSIDDLMRSIAAYA